MWRNLEFINKFNRNNFDILYNVYKKWFNSVTEVNFIFIIVFPNFYEIYFRFCHLPMTPDEPHPMNQNIMISNGRHLFIDINFIIWITGLYNFDFYAISDFRGRRGWIYNYLCNQCLSPLMLWVRISIGARWATLCDKVCQWLVTGRWFSPGLPVSFTNKTDHHDILTEILLKVALNTIKQTKTISDFSRSVHSCI